MMKTNNAYRSVICKALSLILILSLMVCGIDRKSVV